MSHHTLVSTFIQGQLDVIDKFQNAKQRELALENEGVANSEKKKVTTRSLPPDDKYHLGAPQHSCSFMSLEEDHKNDQAFKDFRK